MEKKDSMMNKLLEIFKRFFNKLRGVKTLLLTEVDIMEDDEEKTKEEDMKERFRQKLEVEEHRELVEKQRRYEQDEITEEELTIVDITNLIELYKKQIDALDMEISIKKAKLNKA